MLPTLVLAGCGVDEIHLPGGFAPPPPLALAVDAPAYGAYVGDRAPVRGHVSDPAAEVWIEGYQANVGSDGSFSVEVPVDGDFRVIDVEAIRPGEHLRERRPVFSGADPLTTWTGGLGLRLTPVALDHVAELVKTQVVALDLPGTLGGLVPGLSLGSWSLTPTGTSADAPVVTLVPGPEGLALTVAFGRIELDYEWVTGLLGTIPLTIGIDELTLGAVVTLGLDADGAVALAASDTDVTLGDPVFEVAGIDPDWLESLAGGITGLVGDLAEGAFDLGAILLGDLTVPVGAIDASSLGLPLTFELDGLATDHQGVAATLAVDLGVPPAAAVGVPKLEQIGGQADVAVAVHEGLLVGLLESDLLTMLDLGLIELPGALGEIAALPLSALPGGTQLPADRTGMCLTIDLGEARTARLRDGLAPLGVVILPDLHVVVGVSTPTTYCEPWLDASLAVEVALNVDGTVLTPDIRVVDGAVLAYAAEGEFDEDELVGGLGGLVDVAIGLLGGSLAIDLGDALTGLEGTPLGDLSPRALDVDPVLRDDGSRVDGVKIVTLSLWN